MKETALNLRCYLLKAPVPVAARSKAKVCGRWAAEIVGSNPTGSMDICRVRFVCSQVEVFATS